MALQYISCVLIDEDSDYYFTVLSVVSVLFDLALI